MQKRVSFVSLSECQQLWITPKQINVLIGSPELIMPTPALCFHLLLEKYELWLCFH